MFKVTRGPEEVVKWNAFMHQFEMQNYTYQISPGPMCSTGCIGGDVYAKVSWGPTIYKPTGKSCAVPMEVLIDFCLTNDGKICKQKIHWSDAAEHLDCLMSPETCPHA